MVILPAVAAADANPMLTTFATAAQRAGLADNLNYSHTSITMFVPDNAAFTALRATIGAQRYDALMADKTALADLVKNLVISKKNGPRTLNAAGTVSALGGDPLRFQMAGATMTVANGRGEPARVVCGDIPTSNAHVYIIDKVLTPTSWDRKAATN
jgi:uncharacterized surface protein with fasciclin (FAS1) repeats